MGAPDEAGVRGRRSPLPRCGGRRRSGAVYPRGQGLRELLDRLRFSRPSALPRPQGSPDFAAATRPNVIPHSRTRPRPRPAMGRHRPRRGPGPCGPAPPLRPSQGRQSGPDLAPWDRSSAASARRALRSRSGPRPDRGEGGPKTNALGPRSPYPLLEPDQRLLGFGRFPRMMTTPMRIGKDPPLEGWSSRRKMSFEAEPAGSLLGEESSTTSKPNLRSEPGA